MDPSKQLPRKFANAALVDPIISMNDWSHMYAGKAFGTKTASAKKVAADSTRYLLSHCTIMASVMTEADPEDHLIKPECSHLVNNNDDAWTNEVLKLSHKSFVGAFNFLEHFQNSKHAKGHILDSVLRKVAIAPETWVYFCDILVATDLTHEKLVGEIRDQKVKYMSMGCVTDLVICSFCGSRVSDTGSYCNHLQFQKGMFMQDNDGIPRRIAELCGHKSMPNGGVKFVEASWVATPAFPGAVLRGVLSEGWDGPKTPYTSKAAAVSEDSFRKAASANSDFQNHKLEPARRISADLRRRLS